MTAGADAYEPALHRAHTHALAWLDSMADRGVPPRLPAPDLLDAFSAPLPDPPTDPAIVVDRLVELAEPGLMAMPSGRFFGWVIGGTLPAALAADWLVSAWDQNTAMQFPTPGVASAEAAAGRWLLDLLGLPVHSAVGFVTGATMANFTALAAGRHQVLADAGWDVEAQGLCGSPKVRVLVGAERHDTIDLVLRYLGLGAPTTIPVDEQGRIRLDGLRTELDAGGGPTIVCLQAGNLHSGAFDPIGEAADLAHRHGAWVHVDGAFGLWAGASPRLRGLVDGYHVADSWGTDAHKTLNVPYDCGISIVARPEAVHAAMSVQAHYLINSAHGSDPIDKVPEFSRRARGVPVWAALRSLGRDGVAELTDRLALRARQIADGISAIEGAEVLNEVVFTQVCATFGSDQRTKDVTARLLADGTTWMSGSRWRDRDVLRVSVSNWSTDEADVEASLAALTRAAAMRSDVTGS